MGAAVGPGRGEDDAPAAAFHPRHRRPPVAGAVLHRRPADVAGGRGAAGERRAVVYPARRPRLDEDADHPGGPGQPRHRLRRGAADPEAECGAARQSGGAAGDRRRPVLGDRPRRGEPAVGDRPAAHHPVLLLPHCDDCRGAVRRRPLADANRHGMGLSRRHRRLHGPVPALHHPRLPAVDGGPAGAVQLLGRRFFRADRLGGVGQCSRSPRRCRHHPRLHRRHPLHYPGRGPAKTHARGHAIGQGHWCDEPGSAPGSRP